VLLDPIKARLEAEVPSLSRRVEGAAELSALVKAGQLPQVTPHAFLLPLGFRAERGESVTGLFTQVVADTVGVLLVERVAGDATGGKVLPKVEALADAVLGALAGWEPDADAFDVLVPVRGDLVSLTAGTVMFQLNFAVRRQLRIAR